VAFIGTDNKEDYVVVNGTVVASGLTQTQWPLTTDDEGEALAVVAQIGRKRVLWTNSRTVPIQRHAWPGVGADGRTVGFVDMDDVIVGGDRVKVDGDPMAIAIGPDGKLAAYAVYAKVDDHETEIVWGGRRIVEKFEVHTMRVSPDGKSLAYIATREQDGRKYTVVVVDGRDGPPTAWAGSLRFAPDGRVVYRASKDDSAFLVVGDRAYALEGQLPFHFRVVFSPDMKRAGYGTMIGREMWWKTVALE